MEFEFQDICDQCGIQKVKMPNRNYYQTIYTELSADNLCVKILLEFRLYSCIILSNAATVESEFFDVCDQNVVKIQKNIKPNIKQKTENRNNVETKKLDFVYFVNFVKNI